MTTNSVQGDLSQFSIQTLLERISQDNLEGVLHLRFNNETLNTKMIVAQQKLGGIISPFIPQWSKMLVPHVMSSETYEKARLQNVDAATALRVLEQQGSLPKATLESILTARAKMGLMPIMPRTDGRYMFLTRSVYQDFLQPGVTIQGLLEQLQLRHQPIFEPSDTCEIFENTIKNSPANAIDELEYEVIAALANELTLLEVAQRTLLAWDELGLIIAKLQALNMIRIKSTARNPVQTAIFDNNFESQKFVPTKRIRNRLIPGDLAPDFVLPGLNDSVVRLSAYRGKKVLIRFNRQAGCPICNPRNREFIRLYPKFQQANVELLGIFGSSEDVLPLGIGKQTPPYPVLADPQDLIYAKYGVERSLWGMLSPQNWKNMNGIIEGTKMESFRTASEGEATRMPAEFLINEQGIIEQAHYHAFATDFLPLETLLTDWLKIK
jgi:peroxiredoxin